MDFIDLGEKQGTTPVEVSKRKPPQPVIYPTFSLKDDKIPPLLEKAELNTTFPCEIVVKKVSDEVSTWDKNRPRLIRLEIQKMRLLKEKNGENVNKKYDKQNFEEPNAASRKRTRSGTYAERKQSAERVMKKYNL